MKEFVKNLVPASILKALRPVYHGLVARFYAWKFRNPSKHLVVIGVTGTAGKSTTITMLAHILNHSGLKAGYVTTINYFDGNSEHMNRHGLSMPSGKLLQNYLSEMVENGCKYAVIECTSEGLEQNRHLGIEFDMALFTNLSRAHQDSHGSYENYRAAKGLLFKLLSGNTQKVFFPRKVIGVNLDDPESDFYLKYHADEKFGVSLHEAKRAIGLSRVFSATNATGSCEINFEIDRHHFKAPIFGEFNVRNGLLAVGAAATLGVDMEAIVAAMKEFKGALGRMEQVPNERNITVIVDYAPEPAGMRSVLESVSKLPHKRIIHVFGSTGGHRDISKRFEFGEISAQFADVIVITNDDVYESDPEEIARNIEEGIKRVPHRKAAEVITILDRRESIKKALAIAQPNDSVIITGKGSEQFLVLPGNKRVEWDDRKVVKDILNQEIKK
jgi:UDP-N-acetylmuramoyl-L-alanyl-D-glutamate--2,6-diaminopimelate ligase